MVLLQSSVAVSLCVLGLSLSLVSGQDRLAPHGSAAGVDWTNRIVSFDDFGIGTGSPPAFQCFMEPNLRNWYDPNEDPLWPDRVGTNPGANQILLERVGLGTSSSDRGLLLHRGANYYELDGLWCCGPNGGRNFNTNRCVTFTPCPTLELLTGGEISYNRDTNAANFSCTDPALVPQGSPVIACDIVTREWSSTPPTICATGCSDIPSDEMIVDGFVTYTSGTTNARPVGVRATFTCDTGFFFVSGSGSVNRDCQSDGTWSGSTPSCEIVCPDLSVSANLAISYTGSSNGGPQGGSSNARPVGIVATYSCLGSQFTLVGSVTRTCQSDRSWSGSEPTCQIACSDLPVLANAVITYTGGSLHIRPVGIVATYSCSDPLFTLVGSATRTCELDARWSGSQPECQILVAVCPELSDLTDGMISYNMAAIDGGRPEGTVANYSCSIGLRVFGDATRTCRNDTSWSGTEPLCQLVCSDLPVPANAAIAYTGSSHGGSNGARPVGTMATYSCPDSQFTLVGNPGRTCQYDTTWNGSQPECQILAAICPELPDLTDGMISYNMAAIHGGRPEGTVANYSCIIGLRILGDATRTCQNDTSWSGTEPLCQSVFLLLGSDSGVVISTSHSSVMISEVGAGSRGLVCRTDSTSCCDASTASWVYNGTTISSTDPVSDFYTEYGTGYVSLNKRNNETTAAGLYCCVVPTNAGSEETFCVQLQLPDRVSVAVVDGAVVALAVITVLFAALIFALLVLVIVLGKQLKNSRRKLGRIYKNKHQPSQVMVENETPSQEYESSSHNSSSEESSTSDHSDD